MNLICADTAWELLVTPLLGEVCCWNRRWSISFWTCPSPFWTFDPFFGWGSPVQTLAPNPQTPTCLLQLFMAKTQKMPHLLPPMMWHIRFISVLSWCIWNCNHWEKHVLGCFQFFPERLFYIWVCLSSHVSGLLLMGIIVYLMHSSILHSGDLGFLFFGSTCSVTLEKLYTCVSV